MAQITRKKKAKRGWLLLVPLVFFIFIGYALLLEVQKQSSSTAILPGVQTKSLLALNEIVMSPEETLDHPEYIYERRCSQEGTRMSDIQNCYPDAPLQPVQNNNPSCDTSSGDEPLTWDMLQKCWVGRRNRSSKSDIIHNQQILPSQFQIHVIGERNSGTKWLQEEITKCFPKKKVGVRCHRDFLRSKHFFQPPSRGNYETNLVIAIVRDPLEWLAAMREKPYHMPHHMAGFDTSSKKTPAIPLDWPTFLQRASPWTQPGLSEFDRRIVEQKKQPQNNNNEGTRCVQGFSFSEVTPCIFDNSTIPRTKWRGHMPVYELSRDRSGRPFADLMKLRSDKILNFFLEVPLLMQLGGYAAVRYDDLLRNGTRVFLEEIAAMMGMKEGLPDACRPQIPHPERIGHRSVPPEVQQWMEDHLVLKTEQFVGYR